jgi:hypothetical protein
MPTHPTTPPDTNWKKIYLLVLLFNALLITAFYLLGHQFNVG